jgi:type II restriction enzyme
LNWLKPGTKANDYQCPSCGFWFQLKSQKSQIGRSITDGAYGAMMDAIQNDRSPNFFFLHYDLTTWTVRNLLLVPHFAFPPSAIIKRKPLSPTARRAGWIGCNFDLRRVPTEARIWMVQSRAVPSRGSTVSPAWRALQREQSGNIPEMGRRDACPTLTAITLPSDVRAQFKRIKPLKDLSLQDRGWTLDVLTAIRSLHKPEFTNGDAYTLADQLSKLHPDNRHIRDKIRQQLQVLRDAGLLLHVDRGLWRLP